MKRRDFIKHAGLLAAAGLLPLGRRAWAARDNSGARSRLVVVFLRGAVDGLNVVVPYGESDYYNYRPTIAIPPPGRNGGALNLDGRFGLHPALQTLSPLWQEKSLAFVHACGLPDPSRSHFETQAYMESGRNGVRTADGWMNRLLAMLPGRRSPTEAVSFGAALPHIFDGGAVVANMPVGRNATRPIPMDRPVIEAAFDRLYDGSDPLSRAYREGQTARRRLLADLRRETPSADNGAPPAQGFSEDTQRLARMVAADPGIRLAFFSLGGWDTHVNEGASEGQLAGHLRALGAGLMTLAQGLGKHYAETVVLVISEFGRTAHENGNGGTDHGHGNAMWVLGGAVRGGKVYGEWPGLAPEQLYQARDLAITTDFRTAVDRVLARHLRLDAEQRRHVIPDFTPPKNGLAGLLI